MVRSMRPLLLLLVTAALSGQSPNPALSLLEEARAQPVEIFADIAFKLIPRLPPAERLAALEEIFERAGEARDRFPGHYPDGEALDALSLRTRAIRTMLPLDAKRGRKMFDALARPRVPRAGCNEPGADDAGVYMDTVAAVFRQGSFTEKERREGLPWSLVIDAVRQSGSSAEIAAAASSLPRLAKTGSEELEMSAALAAALTIQDSDRNFSSVPPARLAGSVRNTSSFLRQTSPAPLFLALRDYLVRHLTAARCEGTADAKSDGVEMFGQAVAGRKDILPLTPEETKASKREGKPETRPEDPAYTELSRRARALSSSKPGQDLAKIRSTPEWSDQARAVLADAEAWKGGTGHDSVEIAGDKLKLLIRIVDIAPGGVIHKAALSACVNILGDPAFLLRSPARWISEMRYFMALGTAFTPESLAALSAANARIMGLPYESGLEIPELLIASRSPALSLYGRLILLQRESPGRTARWPAIVP